MISFIMYFALVSYAITSLISAKLMFDVPEEYPEKLVMSFIGLLFWPIILLLAFILIQIDEYQ